MADAVELLQEALRNKETLLNSLYDDRRVAKSTASYWSKVADSITLRMEQHKEEMACTQNDLNDAVRDSYKEGKYE